LYGAGRPSKAIIDALQYNLEEFERLSVDELNVVRETVTDLINSRIDELGKSTDSEGS